MNKNAPWTQKLLPRPAASAARPASRQLRLRPPQTAVDRLAHRSLTTPGRAALIDAKRCWTYREAFDTVAGLTRLLALAGVDMGDRVAVIVDDPMHHLLLVLACEGLAAASASLQPTEAKENPQLLEHFEHVISDSGALASVTPTVIVDSSWFRATPCDQNLAPAPRHEPDDCVRIAMASGCTRRPQLVALTRRMVRDRVGVMASTCQLSEDTVDWMVVPLSVPLAYVRALAVLAVGGAIAFGTDDGIAHPAKVSHLLAPPSFLESLARSTPSWRHAERLAVCVFGGKLPSIDRAQLLATVARSVRCFYSTTEAGLVCEIGRDGVGWKMQDTEVKVLDEESRTVPDGLVGRIAIRSKSVVNGYLASDTMTRRHFRDGWFITQDRGLTEGEHLYLSRRDDGMLNIGGHKLHPETVEALCLRHPDVMEAGACSFRTPEGRDVLVLGLVLSPELDLGAVGASLLDLLPPWIRSVRAGILAALPKGPRGEVLREQLRHQLDANAILLNRRT